MKSHETLSNQYPIELKSFDSSKEESLSNQKRTLEVGLLDSINITAIFSMFLKKAWEEFLLNTAHYAMFGFAAFGAALQAVLVWRQASKDRYKGNTIAKGVIETLSAVGIGVAVLGGFFANATFATVSPIFFTAVMGFKSVAHIGMSVYHSFQWGKASAIGDIEGQAKQESAVVTNLAGAAAGVLATVAVGLVMIALKPVYAIFGVIAGAIGTGLCVFHRFFSSSPKKTPSQQQTNTLTEPLLNRETRALSDPARLQRRLTNENTSKPLQNVVSAAPVQSQLRYSSAKASSVTTSGTFRPNGAQNGSDIVVTITDKVARQRRF